MAVNNVSEAPICSDGGDYNHAQKNQHRIDDYIAIANCLCKAAILRI